MKTGKLNLKFGGVLQTCPRKSRHWLSHSLSPGKDMALENAAADVNRDTGSLKSDAVHREIVWFQLNCWTQGAAAITVN
ncbi:hypothetical protein EOD39_16859 [Acipenser ruthenus]|uniref:Uncharacterized protein n=1 Tax=Acipenser ruthenus TaxID=7906 RepID=A0A444V4X8_ACIRT|nr:hypothetical protein EOD39_16859 [Acipenser ruthenus]